MKTCFLFCLCFYFTRNLSLASFDFSFVSGILDDNDGDVLAAFGDINADKLIDIFVIDHSGKEIYVLLATEKGKYDRRSLNINQTLSERLVSGIMLADFNGDALMDLLVCSKDVKKSSSEEENVYVTIYWGNGSTISPDSPCKLPETFKDQPVLFDFNADMIADLLTENHEGNHTVYQSNGKQNNFTQFNLSNDFNLSIPHSSAFLDLNVNYNADLLLTAEKNEFQLYKDNDYETYETYRFSRDVDIGQSSFADFNQDGQIEHIIPVLGDENDDRIEMFNGIEWKRVTDEFHWKNSYWRFLRSNNPTSSLLSNFNLPATLRVGDYNMDGYPDLITILYSYETNESRPFLFKNVANGSENVRQFIVQWDVLPDMKDPTLLATFYDLDEDGVLDIIITAIKSRTDHLPYTVIIRNNLALDTCFLKVTVISGLCSETCHNQYKPYGVNVPGPTVRYHTTRTNSYAQTSCASAQLSQSAHFALQLPFVSFGLGQMPNFVDDVYIGIPQPKHSTGNRTKFWTMIIPNAQLMVNPNPINDSSNWNMKLFVMPSRQIYLTGIALLSTCLLLALTVTILLWNERREDTREKKEESQKFHFDAM